MPSCFKTYIARRLKDFSRHKYLNRIIKYSLYIALWGHVKNDIRNISRSRNNFFIKGFEPRPRVAYLRTEYWLGGHKSGGAAAHTKGVVEEFARRGFEIMILSSYPLDYINSASVPNYTVEPELLSSAFGELRELEYNRQYITKAYSYIKNFQPSFIYHRYGLNSYAAAYLSKRLNIPMILEYNGSEIWMSENWGSRLRFKRIAEEIESLNFHSASLIIGNAKPLKDELIGRGVQSPKIVIIPNGVNPDRYSPSINGDKIRNRFMLSADTIVVGFVGTFGPWHGAEVLARSIRKVVNENPAIHFLYIGTGATMPLVKRIIKDDNMNQYVIFTGEVPQAETPEFLAACDILVAPQIPNPDGTPFFGSPTKLFEYMAMGKAIVASNLDQIGEILVDGETAVLFTPGDHNTLAEKILMTGGDKSLREYLGHNARKVVEKQYTWEKHVDKLLNRSFMVSN